MALISLTTAQNNLVNLKSESLHQLQWALIPYHCPLQATQVVWTLAAVAQSLCTQRMALSVRLGLLSPQLPLFSRWPTGHPAPSTSPSMAPPPPTLQTCTCSPCVPAMPWWAPPRCWHTLQHLSSQTSQWVPLCFTCVQIDPVRSYASSTLWCY